MGLRDNHTHYSSLSCNIHWSNYQHTMQFIALCVTIRSLIIVSKDVTSTNAIVKIDVDIIKQTDNYTYLGQTITSNGKCDDEIMKIIEIAIRF